MRELAATEAAEKAEAEAKAKALAAGMEGAS